MSIKIMSLVFDHSNAEGTERLVMLALADFCDDEGTCYPGIARVAHKCRVSERTVQRSLSALRKLGEVIIEQGKGVHTDTGATNRFTLRIGRGDNLSPLASGDKQGSQGVTALSPKPSVESSVCISGASDVDLLGLDTTGLSATITLTSQTPAELFPSFTAEQQQEFYSAWNDFAADRAERHCALTSRAAAGILKKLQQQPDRAALALRVCIERRWRGFEWAWLDNSSTTNTARANAERFNGKPKSPPPRMLSAAQQRGRK